MWFVILCCTVPVVAYLCGGSNGAIIFSKLIYHKDIREYGSKNPGFTNFKRVFGSKVAWFVFIFDILKTVVPVVIASFLFSSFGTDIGAESWLLWKFGAAYSGLFCMIGHAYPVWYRFKGGKTFSCGVAIVWFIDWRVGLICAAIFLLSLLLITKIMSLSSCLFALCFPIGTLTAGFINSWMTLPLYITMICINFRK